MLGETPASSAAPRRPRCFEWSGESRGHNTHRNAHKNAGKGGYMETTSLSALFAGRPDLVARRGSTAGAPGLRFRLVSCCTRKSQAVRRSCE